MRHGMALRKLNRTAAHRTAMFANMAASLIKHELIRTNPLGLLITAGAVGSSAGLGSKAFEIADYGSRLPADLQYPGEAPFEDLFAAHVQLDAEVGAQRHHNLTHSLLVGLELRLEHGQLALVHARIGSGWC